MELRHEGPIEWKVEKCLIDDLEKTLNEFQALGFEVEKFEQIGEQYNGFMWVVIGWKPKV